MSQAADHPSDPVPSDLHLHGFSPWSPSTILQEIERGTPTHEMPGDFSVVQHEAEDPSRGLTIAGSLIAARPYYFARDAKGALVHGVSVFDVARRASLPWRWNRRAISCLALFGHTLGGDTLHRDIFRAPAAAVVKGKAGTLTVDDHSAGWSSFLNQPRQGNPRDVLSVLRTVFREMADPDAVVSLSAGFDSRLLLALALSVGHRPAALTMGYPDSTDRVVAARIARQVGLEHRIVELQGPDYLKHARDIVFATSGSKTAAHWHTDLYVRAAGMRNAVHYVGSNGEFARSFYLDKGTLTRALDAAPSSLLEPYLALRMLKRSARFPSALFAGGPTPLECAEYAASLVRGPRSSFVTSLDHFYASQRVRHFIGNGLALYAQHCRPRSPFLDARWIKAVAALPRTYRIGSNFHRYAIAELAPALLEFSVGSGGPMRRRAGPLYHLRAKGSVGYSAFDTLLALPTVKERIVDTNGLDEVLPRKLRIVETQRKGGAIELLLTLAYAAEIASAAQRPSDARSTL